MFSNNAESSPAPVPTVEKIEGIFTNDDLNTAQIRYRRGGGVEGPDGYLYTPEDLDEIIERVLNNPEKIAEVPTTQGLQYCVYMALQQPSSESE